MSKQIKPFIKKTFTDEYLDESPKRDITGEIVYPPNEPGKGPWKISLVKPHKRAPNPTSILFKRSTTVLVPNPRLEAHQRNQVMKHFSTATITAAHVEDSDNENDRPKSPQHAYARSLLGYPPKQGVTNQNSRNELANMMKGLKFGGKRTRKGKRGTRKHKSRKH
jgi:hypothetical protein